MSLILMLHLQYPLYCSSGHGLSKPIFGDFVVSGLGLIGLLTCQIIVMVVMYLVLIRSFKGIIATSLGVDTNLSNDQDPVAWCLRRATSEGVDGVLITASTSSNQPIDLAAQITDEAVLF